eukprot:4686714-Pyramimonas_sp.AAC.1
MSPAAPPPGYRSPWGPLLDDMAKPMPTSSRPASKSLAKPNDSDQMPMGGAKAPPPDIQEMWMPYLRDPPLPASARTPGAR